MKIYCKRCRDVTEHSPAPDETCLPCLARRRPAKLRTYQRYAPSVPPRPRTLTTRYQQGGYHFIVAAGSIKQAYALLYNMKWAPTATDAGIRRITRLDTGRVQEWNQHS